MSTVDLLPPLENTVELVMRSGQRLRELGCVLVEDRRDEFGRVVERAHWTYGGESIDFFVDRRFDDAHLYTRHGRNLRVTMGRDQWQRLLMGGNITANATGYTGVSGTASSAPSTTTLPNTAAAFPTTGGPNGSLQGQVVWCPVAGVYGTIVSNTATVLTVDQWTSVASASGAAGTTPSNGAAYIISPWAGAALWIGLSTSSAGAVATDVLRSADGLFGDGTTSATATELTADGLGRAFVQPTFPSPGVYTLAKTITYVGSTLVTAPKVLLCNTLPAVGSLLVFESLLTPAPAYFAGSGDNAAITWTINLNT